MDPCRACFIAIVFLYNRLFVFFILLWNIRIQRPFLFIVIMLLNFNWTPVFLIFEDVVRV